MPGRTSVTQMGAMALQQLVEPADCGQLAGCRVCMRGLLDGFLHSAAVPRLLGRLLDLDWGACRTHVGSCKTLAVGMPRQTCSTSSLAPAVHRMSVKLTLSDQQIPLRQVRSGGAPHAPAARTTLDQGSTARLRKGFGP